MSARWIRLTVACGATLALISVQVSAFIPIAATAATRGAGLTAPKFLSTLAGPSAAAMYASGVGWDATLQRIVVADTGNNQIEFFDPSGTPLGSFGSFGSGNGQFNSPRQVATN